jgi:MarR family transcriptional regulator, organic hydroperoxide resistance regulator
MEQVEEIRYLFLAVQREGNRFFAERLATLALTPSQAEVLRVLQDHQPLSLMGLGELLVCETGSPSRLVNGLVEAGFVERTTVPTDRRMVTLALTEKGQAMAEQVQAIEAEMNQVIQGVLETASGAVPEMMALLWKFIAGRPAGDALARRTGRQPR